MLWSTGRGLAGGYIIRQSTQHIRVPLIHKNIHCAVPASRVPSCSRKLLIEISILYLLSSRLFRCAYAYHFHLGACGMQRPAQLPNILASCAKGGHRVNYRFSPKSKPLEDARMQFTCTMCCLCAENAPAIRKPQFRACNDPVVA